MSPPALAPSPGTPLLSRPKANFLWLPRLRDPPTRKPFINTGQRRLRGPPASRGPAAKVNGEQQRLPPPRPPAQCPPGGSKVQRFPISQRYFRKLLEKGKPAMPKASACGCPSPPHRGAGPCFGASPIPTCVLPGFGLGGCLRTAELFLKQRQEQSPGSPLPQAKQLQAWRPPGDAATGTLCSEHQQHSQNQNGSFDVDAAKWAQSITQSIPGCQACRAGTHA